MHVTPASIGRRCSRPCGARTSLSRSLFTTVLLLTLAVPVAAQDPATIVIEGGEAVDGEILVRLRGGTPDPQLRIAAVMPQAAVESLSPTLGVIVVRAPGQSVEQLLQAFRADPNVLYAEPNYIVRTNATPNDSLYPQLYGMAAIGAPAAWNVRTGNTSAVIGMIDSGVDYNHPDLAANIWSAPSGFSVTVGGVTITCAAGSHGFNAITRTCDPLDDNNHGTHTAGTVGASGNNGIGVAGVNWTARIMALKFLSATGTGLTSNAIAAIEFAVQVKAAFAASATPVDVRVLSNSWGGTGYSQTLLDAINLANTNDMLFVASAGNASSDNERLPHYPSGFTAPNVISVAATTSSDQLASFSNFGPASVHLGAPGAAIVSTIRSGGYATFNGTSMAAPHVSGAAMLTLAECSSMTSADLKRLTTMSVDPVPALVDKTITGGRLNVASMMQGCAAQSMSPAIGRGASQTFTFIGYDADGAANIASMAMRFTATADPADACFVHFAPPNQLYLRDTASSAWLGPIAPGSPDSLSNSHCELNGLASSATMSGNKWTVAVGLTFLPAFAGQKAAFLYVSDTGLETNGTGWRYVGTWNVPGTPESNQPPHSMAVRASTGAGPGRVFTYTVRDTGGSGDIQVVQALIAPSSNGVNACWLSVQPATRQIQLMNAAGTAWIGPATMGSSAPLTNGLCTVYPGASSTWSDGDTLTVTVYVTFASAFVGNKQQFMTATDFAGAITDWTPVGTWGVNLPAIPVSVSPNAGSGASQVFGYTISDPNGAGDVASVRLLLSSVPSLVSSCVVRVDPATAQMYLANDAGTSEMGPIAIGGSSSLSNNQCRVDAATSAMNSSGNLFFLQIALTFQPAFAGTKLHLVEAVDSVGNNANSFFQVGTWTVPACSYDLSPATASMPREGGLSFVTVATSAPNCNWAVQSSAFWLGASINGGSGTTTFSVIAVPNTTLTSRVGVLTVGGRTLTVTQAAPAADSTPSGLPPLPPYGAGTEQTFMFTFTDTEGATNIDVVNVLINTFLDGRFGCYVAYARSINVLYLVDDPGTGLLEGLVLDGSNQNIGNSQCTIQGSASSASLNGSILTLRLRIAFSPQFNGNKVVYQAARDVDGNNSGWLQMGVWNVPGSTPQSPAVVSMNPLWGGGSSYVFDFTFSDTDGFGDLVSTSILLNDFLDGAGACYLGYHVPSNTLLLLNDAGDGYLAALPLSGSGSVENSQCRINAAGSGGSGTGSTYTLRLSMEFKSGFAGHRVFYVSAQDGIATSGWQPIGTWRVP